MKEIIKSLKLKIYKILSHNKIYPTIFASIGFSYMSIPSDLQDKIRHYIPLEIRQFLLSYYDTNTWLMILFIITIIMAILGAIGCYFNNQLLKNENEELLNRNEKLLNDKNNKHINTYELFSKYLYYYFKNFKFTSNERISLYKLEMNVFSCIGRYSDNEKFRSKPNRLYQKSQGFIAKVWEYGIYEDNKMPDYNKEKEEWYAYNEKEYGIEREILENIKMKSCAYFGIRLRNSRQITIAVIIFESLNKNGLPFGKLKRFSEKEEINNLMNLIESLEFHIPSLEIANKEGF